MRQLLRLLSAQTRKSLLEWLASRSFLLTLIIDQMVAPLLGLALWSAARPDDKTVTTYYLAILIVQLATVSYEHHTLSNGIYDGTISHNLLTPQPAFIPVLGVNLAMRVLHAALGLPVLAVLMATLSVSFTPQDIALTIPALVFAAAVRFLFTFALATMAFWSQRAHSIVGFGEALIYLLGGSAIPIAFFPDQFRGIVEWLPFRAMLGFPAEIASGSVSENDVVVGYAMQLGWIAVFGLMATLIWQRGVARFTVTGG